MQPVHGNASCLSTSNGLNIGTAVQKKGYVDLHDMAREESLLCKYGYTLPKDPTCNVLCSWTATDPSTYLIRGKTYLDDRKKVVFLSRISIYSIFALL